MISENDQRHFDFCLVVFCRALPKTGLLFFWVFRLHSIAIRSALFILFPYLLASLFLPLFVVVHLYGLLTLAGVSFVLSQLFLHTKLKYI